MSGLEVKDQGLRNRKRFIVQCISACMKRSFRIQTAPLVTISNHDHLFYFSAFVQNA